MILLVYFLSKYSYNPMLYKWKVELDYYFAECFILFAKYSANSSCESSDCIKWIKFIPLY